MRPWSIQQKEYRHSHQQRVQWGSLTPTGVEVLRSANDERCNSQLLQVKTREGSLCLSILPHRTAHTSAHRPWSPSTADQVALSPAHVDWLTELLLRVDGPSFLSTAVLVICWRRETTERQQASSSSPRAAFGNAHMHRISQVSCVCPCGRVEREALRESQVVSAQGSSQ